MEAAVQKFIERPELCNETAAAKVERAGFALTDYLEGVLLGKPASAVALFPQYRETQELAGADRIHPADLWAHGMALERAGNPGGRRGAGVRPGGAFAHGQGRPAAGEDRRRRGGPRTARKSASRSRPRRRPASRKIFWKVCAGFFEAMGLGLLPLDIYVKRAASRVLLQYASLAKGELGRVRPAGSGPGVLLRAGSSRLTAPMRPACKACDWPGAWRVSRRSTTRPPSTAASIRCCWRRRASASRGQGHLVGAVGRRRRQDQGSVRPVPPADRLAAQAAPGQCAAWRGLDQRDRYRGAIRTSSRP